MAVWKNVEKKKIIFFFITHTFGQHAQEKFPWNHKLDATILKGGISSRQTNRLIDTSRKHLLGTISVKNSVESFCNFWTKSHAFKPA